jgi:hypothetical protein
MHKIYTISDNASLTLPHKLDVSAIKKLFENDPNAFAERALIFVSYIYVKGLCRFDEKDAPISIHSDLLRLMMGTKDRKGRDIKRRRGNREITTIASYVYIMQKLSSAGIIEVQSDFRIKFYTATYRLKDRGEGVFEAQKTYVLTNKIAIKAFRKFKLERRKRFMDRSKSHEKIMSSVMELEYDKDAAEAAIGDCSKLRVYHQLILNSPDCWTTDKQGRVYTLPVIIPRALRPFFRWRGERLMIVDISSCQPLLHTIIYGAFNYEGKEVYLYKYLCESGKLYSFLNESLVAPYDINDEDQYKELKTRLFGEVYYGHPDKQDRGELWHIFRKSFPFLAQKLDELKARDHRPLPRLMQEIEADIVIKEVIGNSLDSDFPLVSIHDAVMTTKEGVPYVRKKIEEVFLNDLRLVPKIKNKDT